MATKNQPRAPAEHIKPGERRKLPGGFTATVRFQDGARIHWVTKQGFKSWTGLRAWKKLEKVEG